MTENYRKYMGGVDRGDQFSTYYMNDHKCLKWWHRIFISLLDTCLMNSFILFKEQKAKDMTQLQFREILIKNNL